MRVFVEMQNLKVGPWTEAEITVLRTKYLEGFSDRDIGAFLDRSAGAVEGKRSKLRLVHALHPNRPAHPNRQTGRNYSRADDDDIMARYNQGEAIHAISTSYGVSNEAMYAKIERLFDRKYLAEKTRRRCLWCGGWFLSREPIRVRRQCNNCRQGTADASFLTVY